MYIFAFLSKSIKYNTIQQLPSQSKYSDVLSTLYQTLFHFRPAIDLDKLYMSTILVFVKAGNMYGIACLNLKFG